MSKKIYCIAMFKPKAGKQNELFKVLQALEPNTLREDGCIQYTVTRQIDNPFALGTGYPIAFQEIWADKESFEAHCQRKEISEFFQTHCVAETGLVEDSNVCVYSDEAEDSDAPVFA
ncbi:antibiotic biosynthesis monooxygenase [Agarivorans sp. B2Z047]|uniref:putative quinol monooxygenase n=1 Tax=Agarivorans sp. B2Z047 TaxID=2652721 RepID=UPI00128D2E0B|nr:antibiotic biosynthesis monooxygenase [Agarivorans sp. B2Z047]MPW31779.1 antibiotic biosynthesis monooxygenase [Agarivorans sp. B2Z047]UQN44841.1 antibiotic biosynthesis monooxygenase [Agarivorans sp. B2Z047]